MKKGILFLGMMVSLSWNAMGLDEGHVFIHDALVNNATRITQNKGGIADNKENIGKNTSSITAINKELDDHKAAATQRDKLIDQGRGAQLVTSQHILGIKVNEHATSSNVIDQTNKLLGNEEVEGVTLKDYIQINDPYSGNPAMAKHHKAEMQAVDKTYEIISENKENSETALAAAKENTSSITAINKELDDHRIESDKAIAQLKEQDKLLKATDAKLAKTDENLKEADSKIQKNIDQLEKHHDAVYETIGTTRDANRTTLKVVKADTNRDMILALQDGSSKIILKVDENTDKTIVNEKNIVANTDKTIVNEKNIVANTDKTIVNEKNIVANTDKTIVNEKNIVANTDKTIVNEKNIVANTDKTIVNEKNIVANTDKTIANEKNIVANTDKTIVNEKNIVANTDKTIVNEKNIVANTDKTIANEKNIVANTDKTIVNEKNIATNIEKIEYNSRGISNNSERISSLEGKVDGLETEMKKGFAMAAAMSSIDFQVLDVGDAGLGFGVGNYKNSDAVSLGVGVRPTENMTLNVKGAMSTGKSQETMVGGGAVYKFNLFGG